MNFEDILNSPHRSEGKAGSWGRTRKKEKREYSRKGPYQQPDFDPELDPDGEAIPSGIYTSGPLAGLYIDPQGMAWDLDEDDAPSLPLDISEYPEEMQALYHDFYERALAKEKERHQPEGGKSRTLKSIKATLNKLNKVQYELDKIPPEKEASSYENQRREILEQAKDKILAELQELEITYSVEGSMNKDYALVQDRQEKRIRDKKRRALRKQIMASHLDPLRSLVRGDDLPEISPIRLTPELKEKLANLSISQKIKVLNEYRLSEELGQNGGRPLPGLTKAEKARDVYLTSVYFLKGVSVQEISLLLNIPITSIKKILKRLSQEWAASALVNMDEMRARELARIALVETEAWLSYERSQKTRESRQEFYEYHNGVRIKRREMATILPPGVGNSTFLKIILDCIKLRAEILNLKVPASAGGLGTNTTIQVAYVNDWRGSNFQSGAMPVPSKGSDLTPQQNSPQLEASLTPAAQEILGLTPGIMAEVIEAVYSPEE